MNKAFVFDYVELKSIESDKSGTTLTLYNPTEYDATVTIFAEDEMQSSKPLGENTFFDWTQEVMVKAGKTTRVKVK